MRIADIEQVQITPMQGVPLCEVVDMDNPTVTVQMILEADVTTQGWQEFAGADALLEHLAAIANG